MARQRSASVRSSGTKQGPQPHSQTSCHHFASKGLTHTWNLSRGFARSRFADLRGTSVLAMRLFLDVDIETPHTANACWGFDEGVGMTWFDIKRLHAPRVALATVAPTKPRRRGTASIEQPDAVCVFALD